jgi:ABC-type glycerol-3-phosphate transport system substrate-binding protein
MKKITISLLTLLLISAILTAGCNFSGKSGNTTPAASSTTRPTGTLLPSETPPSTQAVIQGTVSIYHSWNENEQPALVQIIQDFHASYPNVLFDVTYVPVEVLRMRFETEVREGGGPTLLLGQAEWGPELYDSGSITNLGPMTNEDMLSALNPAAVGGSRYRADLISLPYSMQGVVLYRNQDILTLRANTFEEMVTFAQSSTQGENVGAVLERSFLYSGAHLNGVGGQLMDEKGYPAFNNGSGVRWIELLRAFATAGPTSFMNDQDLNFFKSGKVGWIIDGTWDLGTLEEALGADHLAIDPWPAYGTGHLSGFVMAENMYMSTRATGEDRLATWKFMEYFLTPAAQGRLGEVGRIPAAIGATFSNPAEGRLISEAMSAMAGGTTYPNLPFMDIYNVQMDIMLKSVFEGGVSPAAALQTASEAISAEISALTPTPGPTVEATKPPTP